MSFLWNFVGFCVTMVLQGCKADSGSSDSGISALGGAHLETFEGPGLRGFRV